MIPFLVFCLRTEYILDQKYVGCLRLNMTKGDSVLIKTESPLLSILFQSTPLLKADIFIEGEPVVKYANLKDIYGFDFGAAIGSIILTALKNIQNFVISAIVYPSFCIERRIISTKPIQNFTFNTHPSKDEYKIDDSQNVCFWHAVWPYRTSFMIIYDTEEMFDVLRVYTCGHLNIEVSGKGKKYYSSESPVFFAWVSDHMNVSNHFTISSKGKSIYPPFFSEITVNLTTAITVFHSPTRNTIEPSVVHMDSSYPDYNNKKKKSSSKWEKVMPFVFCLTLALIITAIFSIVWCCKYRKRFFASDLSDRPQISDYEYASDKGEMPLPVIQIAAD